MTKSGKPLDGLGTQRAAAYYRWLLLSAVVLFIASFYQRSIHIDEAWIGEQAYWAAKEGAVRSELFRGLLHAESRQLVYHWLFVWQAAGIIRLAGWSILVLRLITLSYLVAFLLISYQYLRATFLTAAACCLFYGVLLANALVVEYGYIFRPEIMVMCLGFCSWVFLQRCLHRTQAKGAHAVLAGLFAGLAAITHLNGLIFIAAGVGVLLWRRQVMLVLVFGLVASLLFSVSFLEILLNNQWQAYLKQMSPAVQNKHTGPLPYILFVINEQKRFLHSPVEITLTLLVAAAGYILYKVRYRNTLFSELVLYLGLLVVALACISQGKTTKYLLLYMPYMCLVVTLAFQHLPTIRQPRLAVLLSGLLLLYFVANFGYTGYLISKHDDRINKNHQLAQHLSAYRNTRVVAPMDLIFPEVNTFSIQGITCYRMLLEARQTALKESSLFAEAARFQRRLVIIDEALLKNLGFAKPVIGRTYGKYRHTSHFHEFYIYTAL